MQAALPRAGSQLLRFPARRRRRATAPRPHGVRRTGGDRCRRPQAGGPVAPTCGGESTPGGGAEPVCRVQRPTSLITASDLFNTLLRHGHLTDRDLSVRCPPCRREMTLGACSILVRRQTTYSCPACAARLARSVAPRGVARITEGAGYSFGDFEMETLRRHQVPRCRLAEVALSLAWRRACHY